MNALKNRTVAVGAVLLMCLTMFAGVCAVSEESDAATITQSWGKEDHDSRTIYATAGDWIDLNFNGGSISSRQYTQFQVSNRPSWMNSSNDGTAVAGDYTINVRWTKENDNGSTLSSANFTVRIIVSNPTYTHTVSYNGNGGTGTVANTIVTDTNGGASNVTLAQNGFSKSGYAFAGWLVNGTVYLPGQSVSVGANASVTATAQWVQYTHTITYDGNGSTAGSVANTVVTDTNNGNTEVTLAANGFVKTGYSFSGWLVGSTVLQPGQTVAVGPDGSVTAVAQWSENTLTASAGDLSAVSSLSYGNQLSVSASNGASLSYAVKSCTGGTASVNTGGTVTYKAPTVNATASYTVTVTVTATFADSSTISKDVSFSVTVDPVLSFTNAATSGTLSVKGA